MKYDHIVIDGNNMARRMFATHKNLYSFVGKTRVNTGLTHGFIKALIKLKMRFDGKIVVAWDTGIKRRKDVFPAYKAARREKGKEWEDKDLFIASMQFLKWACRQIGICQIQGPYDEADDAMYTYVYNVTKGKDAVLLVTNDHDMNQMLDLGVHILFSMKGKETITDEEDFIKREGITSKMYLHAMALAGDKGDGIPGISGVGMKTAIGFLKRNKGFIFSIMVGGEESYWDFKGAREKKILDADPKDIILNLDLVKLKNIWPLTYLMRIPCEDLGAFFDTYGLAELASRSDEVEELA